ncbi:MAG: hypothetical protein NZ949_06770, partial [Candidatus Kapabacteria bacterium]|nr:hypothetical protein [Candidatus Kapabacteria bacterium]
MWFLYCLFAALVSCAIIACQSRWQEPAHQALPLFDLLTLGTFNIEWRGDGVNDRNPRTEAELQKLAELIRQSGVDLLGIQEIENEQALQRLLRYLPEFRGIVGSLGAQQNVGLLYRRGLEVRIVGEYTPLIVQPGRTRPGFVAYCRAGNADFYFMVVHLKSTSRYDSTPELRELSRRLRLHQVQRLAHWVDSLRATGSDRDIVVVGDFNDTP